MIPTFPSFKVLDIADREEVLYITKNFSPYSDFDFANMWSWNFMDSMEISILNNNLVVKFSDYITGDSFYSFIGSNKLDETASLLIKHAHDNQLEPVLKLIPQIVAHNLNDKLFESSLDIDNRDYVLETKLLSTLEGPDLSSKRRAANIFERHYGKLPLKIINLSDSQTQTDIITLFNKWINHKLAIGADGNNHELTAIERCLEQAPLLNLFSIGMYDGPTLIAFWILGLRENKCSTSHFEKADVENYQGIFPYFKREAAKLLIKHTLTDYINLEQDLGLPGLRQSKTAFYPTKTFDKYIVKSK